MFLPFLSSLASQAKSSSSASQGSVNSNTADFSSLLADVLMTSMMSSTSLGGLTGSSESDPLFGSSDSSGFMSSGGSSMLGNPFLTALSSMKNIQDVPQEKLLPIMLLGMMSSTSGSGSDSSQSSGMGDSMMAPVMMAIFQKMFSGGQTSTSSSAGGGTVQNTSQTSRVLAARSAYGDSLATTAAKSSHINQFEAELLVGGNGSNADCGPTSLVMALRALGLKVKGETGLTNNGEAVDLARLSMVTDPGRDGVDESGNRADIEHNSFTDLDDITRGAQAAGAKTELLSENAQSIRSALEKKASVIVTGTFTDKTLLPWTGDRGVDDSSAPGGAGRHIISVTGYDSATNQFLVQDPARSTPVMVSEWSLNHFMSGNAGAIALYR